MPTATYKFPYALSQDENTVVIYMYIVSNLILAQETSTSPITSTIITSKMTTKPDSTTIFKADTTVESTTSAGTTTLSSAPITSASITSSEMTTVPDSAITTESSSTMDFYAVSVTLISTIISDVTVMPESTLIPTFTNTWDSTVSLQGEDTSESAIMASETDATVNDLGTMPETTNMLDPITTLESRTASEYLPDETESLMDFTSVTDIVSSTICMYHSHHQTPSVRLTID